MKINQEVFDKTILTEIEILRSIPRNLIESSKVTFREFEDYELAIVGGQVLRYILTTKDELEVEYVGVAATLENRAEIISRARELRNELQSIITFNFKIPDKDSRLTDEQIDIVRKAFNMFEKLKEEECICLDELRHPDCLLF